MASDETDGVIMTGEDMMTEMAKQVPKQDEKLMAGFSYLFGWIPALIFWAYKKNESEYLRFHAMQAVLFSLMLVVLTIFILFFQVVILPILMTASLFGVLALIVDGNTFQQDPIIFINIMTGGIVLLTIFSILLVNLPVLILEGINLGAAVAGFLGRNWRYPILANWTDKINAKDQAHQAQRNVT